MPGAQAFIVDVTHWTDSSKPTRQVSADDNQALLTRFLTRWRFGKRRTDFIGRSGQRVPCHARRKGHRYRQKYQSQHAYVL
jgi:hypothetical protein